MGIPSSVTVLMSFCVKRDVVDVNDDEPSYSRSPQQPFTQQRIIFT